MENLIIKLFDSATIPAIIATSLYLIWHSKLISIIKSSDIEKIFFTHEKRQIYRAFNWLMLFLITFIFLIFTSFIMWSLLSKYKFISQSLLNILVNVISLIIVLLSFIIFLRRKKNKMSTFLEKLNSSENKVTIIFACYYIILILIFGCSIAVGAQRTDKDKEFFILFCSITMSIFIPVISKALLTPWLFKEKTIFNINENNELWYIIKPIKDNDFLIGDSYEENKCLKIKFIGYDELKKKEIIINKIKIKP
ncbi:MAG: hypothetical protein Q8920_13080 [Bacillota bacterium]|nr:hypothetical protein [Bacillota bacterium]